MRITYRRRGEKGERTDNIFFKEKKFEFVVKHYIVEFYIPLLKGRGPRRQRVH